MQAEQIHWWVMPGAVLVRVQGMLRPGAKETALRHLGLGVGSHIHQ